MMNSSPANHSQFLPEFLLGDETQLSINNTEEGLTSRLGSPGNADSSFMSTSASAMHHISPHSRLTPLRPDYNRGATARLNGPPTVSLFDDKSENTPPSANVTATPSSPTNQMETSPIADVTQDSEGYWVIVFGFPSSHSAHILSIFSKVGNVLEHSIPPSGNWMFIKYSSRIDVRKALTYDKRIFNGNVMIGVTERKNMSQMRPIIGTPNSSFNSIMTSPSPLKSPRIRHLATTRREIQGAESPVPQKDTSIVAKAVDLIFGW